MQIPGVGGWYKITFYDDSVFEIQFIIILMSVPVQVECIPSF